MQDKATLLMNEGATYLARGNSFFSMLGDSRLTLDKKANINFNDGYIAMNSDKGNASGGTGAPTFIMNGTSTFIMNGAANKDPALIADINKLQFLGMAVEKDSRGPEPVISHGKVGTPDTAADCGTFIDISGLKTTFVVGGSGGAGRTYVNIDSDNGKNTQFILKNNSKTIIGDNSQILYLGDSFTQMTGNSHSELHDDSTVIMRGKLKEGLPPWKDYYLENNVKVYNEWGYRPFSVRDNGPLVGLYD